MPETDAFVLVAEAVTAIRDRSRDQRAWDEASVGLAAGVLQRAFGLHDEARNAFLDLARDEERRRAAERRRGR